MDVDDDWVEEDDVPLTLRAKIFALKICRNRCLSHAPSTNEADIAMPALKMFMTLLEHSGSFHADASDRFLFFILLNHEFCIDWCCSPFVKSRIRLQAAISLLHLSAVDAYASVINTNFLWLTITVQVSDTRCSSRRATDALLSRIHAIMSE